MSNPITKTPFLFLLLPLVLGIVLQYYGYNITWSIILFLLGGVIILFSYFIKREKEYNYRWLFGLGVLLFIVSLGGITTYTEQQQRDYALPNEEDVYVGYVMQTPQEKPRSIAHKLYLEKEGINVVCYLQKDATRLPLEVGDEIVFAANLQPFKNLGNPDDFDYQKYMYNQGFVASTYLSSASWTKTGKVHNSLSITALKVRQQLINFYASLGFSGDDLAILSALTLGYQDTLSDDLKQGFRTTGTVHILSVSGLHVAIVFAIISFLLSFLPRSSRFYKLRPLLTIVLLWIYAFITGLPPSVVRASVMLSVFCVAELFNKKHHPLNGLYIAGFTMLMVRPFWLFDIGFQLSFVSVLSILILHPRMVGLLYIRNRVGKYIWNLFALSLVAQLATFPICLYYFGTFPTYFFLANLLIVPMVGLIMYGVGLIAIAAVMSRIIPVYSESIYWLPVNAVKALVGFMQLVVSVFEKLPFALIEDADLSFVQLLLLISAIVSVLYAGMKYSSRSLILSLSLLVLFLSIPLAERMKNVDDQLIVYNRNGNTAIEKVENKVEHSLNSLLTQHVNPVIELGNKKVLVLNNEIDEKLIADVLYDVDYAILVGENNYSIEHIEQHYKITKFVFDSSLNTHVRRRLTKECENRNILFHDVTKNGAFSFIF